MSKLLTRHPICLHLASTRRVPIRLRHGKSLPRSTAKMVAIAQRRTPIARRLSRREWKVCAETDNEAMVSPLFANIKDSQEDEDVGSVCSANGLDNEDSCIDNEFGGPGIPSLSAVD